MNPDTKIYFPGLNALRFFAALAVMICHVELIKHGMGIRSVYTKSVLVRELGSLGVYFFFVLSGFLITYLLLREQEKNNTVSVKKFYMRRILRIWPLYLFITIIGFFILPFFFKEMTIDYLKDNFNKYYTPDLLLYLVMLPNVAFAFFTAVPHIGHLWSIGVEEQFYATWPWLFKNTRSILKKLIVLFFMIVLLKGLFILYYKWHSPSYLLDSLKNLVAMSKFENMVIGGIGACILYNNNTRYLALLRHNLAFYLSLIMVPVLVFVPLGALQDGVHIVYSVLFLIIILNVVYRTSRSSILESKTLSHLGHISYGIYMYHMIIIAFICYFLRTYQFMQSVVWSSCIIYPAAIILTVATSHYSYKYLESYFLKLKDKFN